MVAGRRGASWLVIFLGLPCLLHGFLLPSSLPSTSSHLNTLPVSRTSARRSAERRPGVEQKSTGFRARLMGWKSRVFKNKVGSAEEWKKEVKTSGLMPLAMAGLDRFAKEINKGIGVNPIPVTFWQQWGPYVTTIAFMIFAFRGIEPVYKFLYEMKKRKRDAEKAKSSKKKNRPYRATSRLYEMAKLKLEQGQEGGDDDKTKEGGEEAEEAVVEEEPRLSAWRCERCGFTLYPAKGREFKFFSDRFKCPSCGATKELFYDANDPDDPRNQEPEPSDDTDIIDDEGDDEDLMLEDGEEGEDDLKLE